MEPLISQQVKSANKFLWAIKTYLDLISRDDQLVYGSGLKRLYTMSSGVNTLNDGDIEAITAKSERLGLLPGNLHGFMISAILKNIELYGRALQGVIESRIVSISNGDVKNPDPLYKFSAEESRRYFYVPPHQFVARLHKALGDDIGDGGFNNNAFRGQPIVTRLQDVANDADIILTQMQNDEGHITPIETSWGALASGIEGLIDVLRREAAYPGAVQDYRTRARACLKILWFIGKTLLGDLTVHPQRKDINLIDLNVELNLTDGTLASIPFPLKDTLKVFSDEDGRGISMKGRFYLQAVSAASFHVNENDIDD